MNHWQKISFLTKTAMYCQSVYFFLLVVSETHRRTPHWKSYSSVRFQGVNGLCFPWSKKEKETSVCMYMYTRHHIRNHLSQFQWRGLARRWLRTTGFTSVLLNSIQFLAAEFKPQPFFQFSSPAEENSRWELAGPNLPQESFRDWMHVLGRRRWYIPVSDRAELYQSSDRVFV